MPDFDITLSDGAASSVMSPPVVNLPRPRVHTSAIASSLALLYPTVDAALQTGIITIVVFLHNVALLSLAFCCMKANKRILIMGLFIWLALFPWVLDHYWHTNVTERQIMSYMTVVLHGFRLLRVWGGMLPKEATESFVNYMMYCALPGELKVSDDGRLVKAPRGVLLRRFVPCWLFHTLCLYLMASYGHQLAVFFLPKQFTGVLDPWALPYAVVDVSSLYIAAAYGSLFGCVVCSFFGYDSEVPFILPWHASTFRELWGKRWNRCVQVHLNRIFFVPFRNRGMPAIGGFCAFLYSAVFHEYIWWFNFRENYRFGENSVFFISMYFICAGEAQMAKSKFAKMQIPRWFRNAVVAFVCVYSSRFVTSSCHRANSFADIGNYFPRVVYDPTGAHGSL